MMRAAPLFGNLIFRMTQVDVLDIHRVRHIVIMW